MSQLNQICRFSKALKYKWTWAGICMHDAKTAFRINKDQDFLGSKSSRKKNCARLRKIALGLRKIALELRFCFLQNICVWGPHDQDPDHDEQGSWSGPWLVPILCMLMHDDPELANMYGHAWAMHACMDMYVWGSWSYIDPAPCPSCMCMTYSASRCARALFSYISFPILWSTCNQCIVLAD